MDNGQWKMDNGAEKTEFNRIERVEHREGGGEEISTWIIRMDRIFNHGYEGWHARRRAPTERHPQHAVR
jgi:hypothetical protein